MGIGGLGKGSSSWLVCDVAWVAVGLVTGHGSEEMRAAVGRRLAGVDRQSRLVLGSDEEDSPLQDSKRSSMCPPFI